MDASVGPWAMFGPDGGTTALIAACLLARVAATVEFAAPAILPAVGLPARAGVAVLWSLAGLPAALAAGAPGGDSLPGWGTIGASLAAEAVIGAAGGLAIAALCGALAWGGEILGAATGLAWSDGGEEGDDDGPAGVPRLARWLALAAFVSAGGIAAAVGALIDGARVLPPGTAAFSTNLASMVVDASATALALAVALALPALVALLALQLVAACLLRVGECDAGPGLLPAATVLVLVAAIAQGAGGWVSAAGERLVPLVTAAALPHVASGTASGSASGFGETPRMGAPR